MVGLCKDHELQSRDGPIDTKQIHNIDIGAEELQFHFELQSSAHALWISVGKRSNTPYQPDGDPESLTPKKQLGVDLDSANT